MKYRCLLILSMIYVAIMLVTYWVHVSFFQVNVVFYSAIVDTVIASLVMFIFITFNRSIKIFNKFEKFQILIIWLVVGYAFAISVPTVIDRSLSFYTLEKLQQRGGGIVLSAFERMYANEYMKEHRLVDVRLTEQIESGTIIIKNGCVKLTSRGNSIATISRYFRAHFLPKKRLLMGEYSDDLTDPFRSSHASEDYLCE